MPQHLGHIEGPRTRFAGVCGDRADEGAPKLNAHFANSKHSEAISTGIFFSLDSQAIAVVATESGFNGTIVRMQTARLTTAGTGLA